MKTPTLQIIFIVLISFFAGYYIGVSKISFDWKQYSPQISVTSKEPPASLTSVDFSLFWNVWQKLIVSYYDKGAVDSQKLLHGAISGMVQSLGDPYTVFLPPSQNSDFKQGMAGQFSGIGAELGIKDKQIIVVAPIDQTPAQKAGIKAGDIVLKVDNQSTSNWTVNQAVEKIRGERGTKVILTVLHKGNDKPYDIPIIRDTITVKSVTGWVKKITDIEKINQSTEIIKNHMGERVMYIKLSQFGDNTNNDWTILVNTLLLDIKTSGDIEGIVLDMRNNPGGYLTDANYIASEFIKSGVVVIQEKGGNDKISFPVTRKGLLTDYKTVALINKGSASASEIVAGALRDNKKVKLIGETSFGKGTIQQAEDLGSGAGLHVTIAKWLTPSGIWVHGKGLTPDVFVVLDEKDVSHDLQLEVAVEELVK